MKTLKTNEERLEYLIDYMWRERNDNDELEMPTSFEGLWKLYRGLANVRPAIPVSETYLAVQDALLSDLNRQHVMDVNDLKPIKGDNIFVWQGDITTLKIDAIVNAANSRFLGCMQANHDCIDNIIHTKAGVQVRLDCADIIRQQGRKESVGNAKMTRAYNLPAKYIVHTVGPQIRRLPVSKMNQDLLAKCYLSCLKLADQQNLNHIAFCCISTGVFAFPQDEAAEIAIRTVQQYLADTNSKLKVVFNVFTEKDLQLYEEAFNRGTEQ
ncbi:protein-ADP-ribose hydrolase [Staphylococcus sp. 30400_3112M30941]|nr:protein-ADP-ribose hydrolase [Staphylococcus sp. 30403_3112M30944]MBO0945219.1 protein-ADP-ribose hydrolase [Staphylococcus sp. 30402_3112M30943]MBO0964903.1 protein-ADP-ribose hydrolase [Staphylococcus sp. 30400_3112M30941]MBO0965649.1 protein-ADP-ribose hydrolase [Staphylococcus sp. 30401_3112M30942]